MSIDELNSGAPVCETAMKLPARWGGTGLKAAEWFQSSGNSVSGVVTPPSTTYRVG
jgi:hypothetical protein